MTPANYDIRFSELDDLKYLEEWLKVPGACNPFPFDEEEMGDATKNWIGFSKYKASLTGMIGDEVCAIGTLFLMPYRKVAHQCQLYLIVKESARRQGIGTSMVRNLAHLAKTRFKLDNVFVETYEPNPIFALINKLGFTQYARQENFARQDGKFHARQLWGKDL